MSAYPRADSFFSGFSGRAYSAARIFAILLLAALFWPPSWAESAEEAKNARVLLPGLEYRNLTHHDGLEAVEIDALRIDPALFEFSLHSVAWTDGQPRTISAWCEKENLTAAINASMFLPDGVTSTAYMRSGERVNNKKLAARYGAFFVADPTVPGLPPADILDREDDGWQERLSHYRLVVQNFRLLAADGRNSWTKNDREHSVAAMALDSEGHILFLHCQRPLSVARFAEALRGAVEPRIRRALYVEGGAQAAMMVRLPDFSQLWLGQSPLSFGIQTALPNVIGIRPRQAQ